MRGIMKNTLLILMIGSAAVIAACGGGPPLKTTPPYLLAGTEQIIKGTDAYKKGCYKKAFELFFRAHEFYAASDQTDGVAMSLNNLGTVYRATGDPQSALAFFDKACEIYRDLGNRTGEIQTLSNKAAALIDLGRLDQAGAILDEASKNSEGVFLVSLLNNRGVLLTKKKDYAGAEKVLKEALAAVGPENVSDRATVHSALGNLMLEMNRYKEAVTFYQNALNDDRTEGFYKGTADDLNGIGRASLALGNRTAAVKHWEQSVKIYALIGSNADAKKVMGDLKTAAEGTGVDIRVTELFLNRWLEGKLYEKPCED